MIVYQKLVRINLRDKHHHKRPITEWMREEFEEFLMNEAREEYSDRIEDLKVEYKYIKAGELGWH